MWFICGYDDPDTGKKGSIIVSFVGMPILNEDYTEILVFDTDEEAEAHVAGMEQTLVGLIQDLDKSHKTD